MPVPIGIFFPPGATPAPQRSLGEQLEIGYNAFWLLVSQVPIIGDLIDGQSVSPEASKLPADPDRVVITGKQKQNEDWQTIAAWTIGAGLLFAAVLYVSKRRKR